jgi:hypothetical protein
MSLFETGIRPLVDAHIAKKAEEKRDYGDYWSASSAGYCMRLNILKRLDVPSVPEIKEDAVRTQRVFEAGHVFHEYMQRITKEAGISIAQELELQDEDLMVRGHIDDLITVDGKLILYDYKSKHSYWFKYATNRDIGHYHSMQLATYMYMLRELTDHDVKEARLLHISKDDLRQAEDQIIWSPTWEKKVVDYWKTLEGYWQAKTIPACTCLDHDGGFMGMRSKKGKIYNPYYYDGLSCNSEWFGDKIPEGWKF